MSMDLIPYNPSGRGLEAYRNEFLVPHDWTSCGPAFYISGAPRIRDAQPVAIALTEETLSLCGSSGPIWSIPLPSIKDVKVTNLAGLSFPVNTPAGIVYMAPPTAIGVEVGFNLTATGMAGRVIWCTLSPQSAYDWVNDITDAIYGFSTGPSQVDRRGE